MSSTSDFQILIAALLLIYITFDHESVDILTLGLGILLGRYSHFLTPNVFRSTEEIPSNDRNGTPPDQPGHKDEDAPPAPVKRSSEESQSFLLTLLTKQSSQDAFKRLRDLERSELEDIASRLCTCVSRLREQLVDVYGPEFLTPVITLLTALASTNDPPFTLSSLAKVASQYDASIQKETETGKEETSSLVPPQDVDSESSTPPRREARAAWRESGSKRPTTPATADDSSVDSSEGNGSSSPLVDSDAMQVGRSNAGPLLSSTSNLALPPLPPNLYSSIKASAGIGQPAADASADGAADTNDKRVYALDNGEDITDMRIGASWDSAARYSSHTSGYYVERPRKPPPSKAELGCAFDDSGFRSLPNTHTVVRPNGPPRDFPRPPPREPANSLEEEGTEEAGE